MSQRAIHYTDNYLINPQHPVTINLVGCGGTGSQVLSGLARLNQALRILEHPGIHVTAWDPDEVTEANIGRQAFSPADLDRNKAVTLIERINRFYGFDWKSHPDLYTIYHKDHPSHLAALGNILITCVDSAKTRVELAQGYWNNRRDDHGYQRCYYWMDFGNSRTSGQVVLGTLPEASIVQPKCEEPTQPHLPTVVEMFPDILKHDNEQEQGPSCSFAEAIQRQDLYINSTLAQLGCNLLWKLFREAHIAYHGVYLNLDLLTSSPMYIFAPDKPMKSTKKRKRK